MPQRRKPARVRKLDGNPGRTPIPQEPDVPKWNGEIPSFLPKDAATLWQQFAPRLRQWIFASQLDEPALMHLCAVWGISMQALRKLKREGITRNGHKNPAAQIWKDNVTLFHQLASKFGMTPADRARLFAGEKPKEDQPIEGSTLDGNWQPAAAAKPN